MKKNKLLMIIISIPILIIIIIISIFVYIEIESKKISINKIPDIYKKSINKKCLESFNLIGHKLNDSMYYFTLISDLNSDNSLFLSNFYRKKDFKITFKKIKNKELSEIQIYIKNNSDYFSSPQGLININYPNEVHDIQFYVEDYIKINDNLYECNSEYLYMLINNEYSSIGIFKNKNFFIEINTIDNQSYLLIYSSSDKRDLYLFKNIFI